MKTEHLTRAEGIARLRELIKDLKIAMLTTVDSNGSLRSRPMAAQQAEFNGDLWFFTYAHSAKADELHHDARVNLAFADVSNQRYISISGRGELLRDPAKAEELWSPLYKAWFPKGLDEPDMALIKVHAEQAEFWDAPSGKAVQLFGLLKAVATGKPYEGEGAEDVKIHFD